MYYVYKTTGKWYNIIIRVKLMVNERKDIKWEN